MKKEIMPTTMKVIEYRMMHPNCKYCKNRMWPFERCAATNQKMSKRVAKRCPCYVPEKWLYEKDGE